MIAPETEREGANTDQTALCPDLLICPSIPPFFSPSLSYPHLSLPPVLFNLPVLIFSLTGMSCHNCAFKHTDNQHCTLGLLDWEGFLFFFNWSAGSVASEIYVKPRSAAHPLVGWPCDWQRMRWERGHICRLEGCRKDPAVALQTCCQYWMG